jgi:hypothetical protein
LISEDVAERIVMRDLEASIDAGWWRLIEHWRSGGDHPSTHECWQRRPAWVDEEMAR